ncbi:MAG TPA: 3-deoxy-manno-octulosonate cytidylyltransferase [Gemmatimonadota bacterium]|nr:3-deoxy-manno-octulosonate cytidylyltransferase [Gemmatimonadota bacterium]
MVLAAIPARWGATRFPGKPLASILGRPMIAWVVDAARSATRVDDVAVVTDHPEIARAAEAAGARAVVSGAPADSGTDRIGHLLAMDPVAAQARIIVNVQGDEPLLEPEAIDAAVRLLDEDLDSDPATEIATLVRPLRSGERADDPHLVKVAVAGDGRALSFSRDPIPHGAPRIHIGLYAYRRTAFDRFVEVAPSPLERLERLEQLRALDLGIVVRCVEFDSRSIAVDRPEDLTRVEAVLEELAGP